MKERKEWMKDFGKELEKTKGYRIIAGDFNYITDVKMDKRGGRKDSGTIGRNIQREWENRLEMTDVWRIQHPEEVNTTWSNGAKDKNKSVKTRIDKIMADDRILDRITATDIIRTRVSDHDAVSWTMETEMKRQQKPYKKWR